MEGGLLSPPRQRKGAATALAPWLGPSHPMFTLSFDREFPPEQDLVSAWCSASQKPADVDKWEALGPWPGVRGWQEDKGKNDSAPLSSRSEGIHLIRPQMTSRTKRYCLGSLPQKGQGNKGAFAHWMPGNNPTSLFKQTLPFQDSEMRIVL